MKRYKLLWAILALCTACTQPNTVIEFESAIVVQGYLYAGQTVKGIELSALIPFGADSSIIPDWDQMAVEIIHQAESFPLSQRTSGSGIFDEASETLSILEGETYLLQINYHEEILSASTTVPPKPNSLQISENVMERTQIDFSQGQGPGGGGGGQAQTDPLEVSWDNPLADYFFLLVENVENNPDPIFLNTPFERNFRFINEPTQSAIDIVQPQMIEFFGTHQVVLFRVDEDYASLYENREQDSRSLNEPFTNIENGLGIFTAVNSDTLYFEVIEP
ncbi:MAG: DUF4249 family protein [Bacteroidia bacterium]